MPPPEVGAHVFNAKMLYLPPVQRATRGTGLIKVITHRVCSIHGRVENTVNIFFLEVYVHYLSVCFSEMSCIDAERLCFSFTVIFAPRPLN